MNKVFKVGLIGCGHIAETYFRAHKYFNNFKIIKCADVKSQAAKKCAKTYRIQAVSVNELLKDKDYLDTILLEGSMKANIIADKKVQEIKKIIGLS